MNDRTYYLLMGLAIFAWAVWATVWAVWFR